MFRTIHLHGSLGRKFGRQHRLDVNSPAEAIRALCNLYPKFRRSIAKGQYEVRVGDVPMSKDTLDLGMGKSSDMHITPAAALAGIETILIIGLGLIAAATIAVTFLAQPKAPDVGDRERDTKDDSWIFDGPVNTTEQGNPVPVIYGRMRVGSVVGSAGLDTTDAAFTDGQATPGDYGNGLWRGAGPGVRGTTNEVWAELAKGGKGGGGSARAAQEDPNTLQSQATARVLDIIGEGEIVGLVDGLKSIYFDETPVQNGDGSYNFAGLVVDSAVGLPDQDPLPNFTAAENSYSVNVEVTQSVGPVVRRLLNDDADRCRVTIGLPRLFKQDTENGDLKQYSVKIAIDHQSNDGGYTEILQHEFRGKCTSPYQRSFDIQLDGPGPHDIRVRRLSPDAQLASIEDSTFLDALTEIVDARLIYPNTALIGLSIDARQFGTSIPSRSYEVDGRIVEVPTNYDPVARTYTGVWDGTFKLAWTDNPAWCIRDLALNKRFGLGNRMADANVDKWTLYSISQHCDELVPDGDGGTRPRYTLNCCLRSQQEAYDVIASFASAFRGWAFWSSGAMVCEQDRDEDPTLLLGPSNVVDGDFNYDRITPRDRRRSVVIMYWNDPDDGYRLTPVIVERPDLIARFGWEPGDELTAFGCTNEAEARTKALFVFEDEGTGNTAASYKAGDDHSFASPARVVELADPRFSGNPRGGRIAAIPSATSATLDREITLDPGATYTLSVIRPDGSVQAREITDPAGAYQTVNLAGGGWEGLQPIDGAVWTLKSDQVTNRLFRIRSIESDEAPYSVRAIRHDPTKYARVEQGIDLPPVNYLSLPDGPLGKPTNPQVREFLLRDGDAASPAILFSWEAANDPRVIAYQAQYQRPGDGWVALSDGIELSREIRNSEPGAWRFRVRSLDQLGRRTAWQEYDALLDAATEALPEVSGLAIATDDVALTTRIEWVEPTDTRPLRFEILRGPDAAIGNAASIGITDQNEFPISESGFYFVRTAFAAERSAAPPSIEVADTSMPEPLWDRVADRPLSLPDLDASAAADLAQAQTDIADLITTYGSTASAASSAAAAEAARDAAQTAEVNAATAQGLAETAQGLAETAEANAANSEANAATSALAASSASDAATQAGAVTMPFAFDQDGTFFVNVANGAPASDQTPIGSGATDITFVDDATEGRQLKIGPTASNDFISTLDRVKLLAGRKYRITARAKSDGAPNGSPIILIQFRTFSAAGAFVANPSDSATLVDETYQDLLVESDADTLIAAGGAYFRPTFFHNAGGNLNSVVVSYLKFEDITESENAAGSASDALSSETAAALSETNAAGSAASASTSETNAANSESAAAGSASAASTSASLAATEAGNAGVSATAAEAFALEASVAGSTGTRLTANGDFTLGTSGFEGATTNILGSQPTIDSWIGDTNYLGEAYVIRKNADNGDSSVRSAAWQYDRTRTYRARVSVYPEAGTFSSLRLWFVFFTASGAYTDALITVSSAVLGSWQDYEYIIDASNEGSVDADAEQVAFAATFLSPSADFRAAMRWLYVEDITESSAAETSATNAGISEANASASEANASTSAGLAATYRDQAQTAEGNAAGSASAAASSASAASTSETNASASAAGAATSESNAASSAATATTQAGIASSAAVSASTSETNASASESNAASSATLAASYETGAIEAATAPGPTIAMGKEYWTFSTAAPGYRDPVANPADAEWVNDGDTIKLDTGSNQTLSHTHPIPIRAGEIWELEIQYEALQDAQDIRVGFNSWNEVGATVDTNSQWLVGNAIDVADGRQVGSALISLSGGYNLTVGATATSFRPHLRINTGHAKIHSFTAREVSAREASAGSAAAALVSEGNASASAGAASTSESNAASSAVTAATEAGNSAASASAASLSETNASTSESNAGASELLAAQYSFEANAEAEAIGLTANAFFEQDSDYNYVGVGYVDSSGPAGNQTFSASYNGDDNVWVGDAGSRVNVGRNLIRVDPARTYRVFIRVHFGDAAQRLYAGVSVFDSAGVSIGNGYQYCAAVNETGLTGWHEFSGDIFTGGSGQNELQAGTAFIRPMAFLNFGNDTGSMAVSALYIEDVTESVAAAGSAAAALTSESSASASASAASTSESNAATSEFNASASEAAAAGSASAASSSATVASTQATVATSEAAAAAASATLAAELALDTLTGNPSFAAWADGATAPTGWVTNGNINPYLSRVSGRISPYAAEVDISGLLTNNHHFNILSDVGTVSPSEYLVIDAEVELVAGKLDGVSIWSRPYQADGSTLAGTDFRLMLYGDEDANGNVAGSGVVGRTYRYTALHQHTDANLSRVRVYAMSKYNISGVGPDWDEAVTLKWHRLSIRRATAQEIAAGVALPTLEASVAVNSGAIASIENTAAFYEVVVAAGGGNPAMVQLLAGDGGSNVGIVADRIALGNDVDGIVSTVLTIENGQAKLNNALIRGLKVYPRSDSEIALDVLLKPLTFLAADGASVQYQDGDSFGAAPDRIEFDISGLPALTAGDSYNAYATNITATGFDAVVKKITAPVQTNRTDTGGTNVGGTPQWQMHKANAADAYDGNYQFQIDGNIPRTSLTAEDFDPQLGTYYVAQYSGTFDLYVTNSNSSNAWTKIGSLTVTHTIQGWYSQSPVPSQPPSSYNFFNRQTTVNTVIAIGQHAGREFGVHPIGSATVSAFDQVFYVSQSSSGTTAVATAIPWKVYPPLSD